MLEVHQASFEHNNERKRKSECFIIDYVATGDDEVEIDDDDDDEESILQQHILTNRHQIAS